MKGERTRRARSVSGAGDVDGDGHDDVLVGAPGNYGDGPFGGAGYLVLGPVTGTLDLSLADAKLMGENLRDRAGLSVSAAGDVDGDGHDDLLVGAAATTGDGDRRGGSLPGAGPRHGDPRPLPRRRQARGEDFYMQANYSDSTVSRARATWTRTAMTTSWWAPVGTMRGSGCGDHLPRAGPCHGDAESRAGRRQVRGRGRGQLGRQAWRAAETSTATATTMFWSAPSVTTKGESGLGLRTWCWAP